MADAMTEFNQKVIEEFRGNGGKVGGAFASAPMVDRHPHRRQEREGPHDASRVQHGAATAS